MKELKERFNAALKTMRDIAAKAESESREYTDDERTSLQAKLAELEEIKGKIKEAQGSDTGINDQLKAFVEFDEPDPDRPAPTRHGKKLSVGQAFVNSPEYKQFMAQFPNGRIPDSAKGLMSSPMFYNALLTGESDTSAGAFVATDVTGIFDALGRRPLTIRDIISLRTTGSDTVEFVRQVARTNNAAPVPEATIATTIPDPDTLNTAGVKPESAYTFEKVTATVATIAHWVPATKRAISDAGQLRGLIDEELRSGLEEELEDQIMEGTGGEGFTGIGNTSGVQAQAWDTNILTTTRKAKTKVRTVGRAIASAYVLNPADWERIDLLQDNEARYYAGGPFNTMTPRLWGLPVVESEAATSGIGYVGDFKKAVLWDREQASVQISDSHADFFIRNLVAILAELRAAFGITRPAALVEMDLTA